MILADLGYGEGRHREVSPFLRPARFSAASPKAFPYARA
jgi:hypothetical protein